MADIDEVQGNSPPTGEEKDVANVSPSPDGLPVPTECSKAEGSEEPGPAEDGEDSGQRDEDRKEPGKREEDREEQEQRGEDSGLKGEDVSVEEDRLSPGGEGAQGGLADGPADPDTAGRPPSEVLEQLACSPVYAATSRAVTPQKRVSLSVKTYPLTLEWAYGINRALPVFSLLDTERLEILYGCANVAVMYDYSAHSQHILQGHCNPISCLCVSEDRRWLVTADKGPDSLVIIWDAYSGIPVQTLFDCHPEGGVSAVALSSDSKLLVTVGAGEIQRVCIWEWTSETEAPVCVTELNPEYGCQNYIIFDPNDSTQLLSNSESQVLFYHMDKANLECLAPELSDNTFKKVVGALSQSIFHSGGIQAFTATMGGNMVVWDVEEGSTTKVPISRTAIKLISLQRHGITVLTRTDSYLVTGNTRGHVNFYDENLKLISWYSKFNLDQITSISFSKESPPDSAVGYLEDCTLEAKPFVVRNFVISTVSATVVHVNTKSLQLQTVVKEHSEALHAVACHPARSIVCMGSYCGILKAWDYNCKEPVCSRVFQKERQVHCLAYDPKGFYLAVGFACGTVYVLDASTLLNQEEECFKFAKDCITHITFSPDSCYLATADAGKAVTVFQLCPEDGKKVWKYQGRHRAHYKPIQDLLFGVYPNSTQPRLLSLGMDRMLVEYDLKSCGKDQLPLMNMVRIEQSAVPTCMAWYPPLSSEHLLLTASDLYKMKLFNSTTKMCRKTVLGPTYGSPIQKMAVLPLSQEGDPKSNYLAYITEDKVGLQILPLDGNPYKYTAIISHPKGVSAFACSRDGKYIFTSGGPDYTVLSWQINLNALEAAASLGGKDMMPFYSLLEGGRDGVLFKEMEDYFYYCQLRSQGIDSMETRQVSTRIPLTELSFVMRALGFFPTEQELEDMRNEVKYSRYAETGEIVRDIDLEEFIKLYINHRPAFEISRDELLQVFKVLGHSDENGEWVLNRDDLLHLLQTRGECMTEEELAECFATLLGVTPEGGRSEQATFDCNDSDALLESRIPEEIKMDTLMADILGFPVFTREPLPSEAKSPTESELS
ncbi:cilia- and flagella-associated protein 251 [Megalops cyprinoides]|uniref:cilia- and flagella-associated protein 251 n=1 Tax=Megalops cyprinoides TaxID=118141 RepID=UPI0018645075|nr:cilia- and flagella-associated protein 251 [Megalops cyprinoides]